MSEECRSKIIRRNYFSGLEKSGRESIDIGMKNLGESDQFGNFDVHTICFQLGISAFGHGKTAQAIAKGVKAMAEAAAHAVKAVFAALMAGR